MSLPGAGGVVIAFFDGFLAAGFLVAGFADAFIAGLAAAFFAAGLADDFAAIFFGAAFAVADLAVADFAAAFFGVAGLAAAFFGAALPAAIFFGAALAAGFADALADAFIAGLTADFFAAAGLAEVFGAAFVTDDFFVVLLAMWPPSRGAVAPAVARVSMAVISDARADQRIKFAQSTANRFYRPSARRSSRDLFARRAVECSLPFTPRFFTMSIKLHLTHALGRHTFSASPRGLDAPVVVGRGPRADIVVPSAAVSIKHLAIFVYGGRWAAQDLRSRNGTFLNGKQVDQPTYLRAGDVLALGAEDDPPTLTVGEIDRDAAERWVPASAVVSKPGAASSAARSASSSASSVASSASGAESSSGGSGWDELAETAVSAAIVPEPEPPVPAEPADEFFAEVPGPALRRRGRRRKRSSALGSLVGLLLVTAAVGGGAWYVYVTRIRPARNPVAAESEEAAPPPKPAAAKGGKKGLFDRPGDSAPAPAKPAPVKPAPPPPAAEEPSALAPPPSEAAASWDRVVESARLSTPKVALWLLIQYRSTYPDELPPAFDKTEQDLLDRLWWERLATLAQRRKEASDALGKIETEIKRTPLSEVESRTQFASRREELRDDLREAARALNEEMRYDGDALVDPSDEGQLAPLRAARDPDRFRDWSARVESALRRSRGGALPW